MKFDLNFYNMVQKQFCFKDFFLDRIIQRLRERDLNMVSKVVVYGCRRKMREKEEERFLVVL